MTADRRWSLVIWLPADKAPARASKSAVIAGLDPAIHPKKKMNTRVKPAYDETTRNAQIPTHFTTAAVWPNRILRSSSVRIAGWPKFGLISFALA